jgi:tRNA (mo5U34)-methyltransferase
MAATGHDDLAARAAEVEWWHSISLRPGLVTPGVKTPATLARERSALHLPVLRGKSVLDIGAWDGHYSFLAEQAGASRVVAVDSITWEMDLRAFREHREACAREGRLPTSEEEDRFHHPDELPGKRGFDLAREALGSKVESVVADYQDLDPAVVGTFDVVLYLGVLYHLPDPVGACRKLLGLTRELAIVESEAIHVPGHEQEALWQFHGVDHLGGGPGNWWVPNRRALEHVLLAAGFSQAEFVGSIGMEPQAAGVTHYRAVVHARP